MPYRLQALRPTDAQALADFYNGLQPATIRTFRPLGDRTTLATCQQIAAENLADRRGRFDLLAWNIDSIVGWAFLANLTSEQPYLGIVVAEGWQGQGIGNSMLGKLLAWGRGVAVSKVYLMVVTDNQRAINLYTSHGFATYDEEFDELDQLPYYHMVVDLEAG
ncbi:MAG: GNAT family N-acetyltransferase [Caldilinea sp.]|nr:GNAT family N-acetyltransferase [Caldilinea sp.]